MGGSSRQWDVLGGRTASENAAYWTQRHEEGRGVVWRNGPGKETPEGHEHRNETTPPHLKLHLGYAGVPENISALMVAGIEERPLVVTAREWTKGDKHFLLLAGDTGNGKSVAAASVLAQAKRKVRWAGGEADKFDTAGCAFETASELSRSGLFGDEARAYWSLLGRVRWLVVDDLGVETINPVWLQNLDGLLNERFGRTDCRTIITTNIAARRPGINEVSPFEERYGARIARRIRENGKVVS